jgi:hypothetical protein
MALVLDLDSTLPCLRFSFVTNLDQSAGNAYGSIHV